MSFLHTDAFRLTTEPKNQHEGPVIQTQYSSQPQPQATSGEATKSRPAASQASTGYVPYQWHASSMISQPDYGDLAGAPPLLARPLVRRFLLVFDIVHCDVGEPWWYRTT